MENLATQSIINNIILSPKLLSISNKVLNGERISEEEGIALYYEADLGLVGSLANYIRNKKHGDNTYFNRNFHIEPTNICVFDCKFCAYSRLLKHKEEGWEYSMQDMLDIVNSYKDKPVTEVQKVKAIRPDIHVKAFTAVELEYMCRKAKMSYTEGLAYLKDCGQNSLPGGGAEIFDEGIRNQICEDKCTSAQWLEIHEEAHKLGMPSNATMLYGHIEKFWHRVDGYSRGFYN